MAFGSFDVFHKGHENYLRQAKELGDKLVVIVSRDSNIKKLKKQEPWFSEDKRVKTVSRYDAVDKAILGNEDDLLQVVVDEKPSILCLGFDQKVDDKKLKKELEKRGLKDFKITRANAYKPEIFKSSKLKKTMKK